MNVLIFILGLALGISGFLYMFSLISGGMNKIRKPVNETKNSVKHNIAPETIGFRGRKNIPPGSRICPLCDSELTKYEGLYASKVFDKNDAKILIMGCRYCYKEN